MKNIVIIGCGSGIGLATAQELQHSHHVLGISKTKTSELETLNIQFFEKNILQDHLDDIPFPEVIDGLIYAPGSINLKPFKNCFRI